MTQDTPQRIVISEDEVKNRLVAAGLAQRLVPQWDPNREIFVGRQIMLCEASTGFVVWEQVDNVPGSKYIRTRIRATLKEMFADAANVEVRKGGSPARALGAPAFAA